MFVDNCTKVTIANSTIDACQASMSGGGLCFIRSNVNVTISETIFRRNTAGYSGGAVYMNSENHYANFSHCEFDSSSAEVGGGIFVDNLNDYVTVSDCSFTRMDAFNGGAITLYDQNHYAVITRCTFTESLVFGYGGDIYSNTENDYLVISDCMFVNSSAISGGSLYINVANDFVNISSCLFSFVSAESMGGAVTINTYNSNIRLHNSKFLYTQATNGGALYVYIHNHDIVVSDCLFVGIMRIGYEGGSVYFDSFNDNAVVNGCTFENIFGGALNFYEANNYFQISNTIFWGPINDGTAPAIYIDHDHEYMVISDCIFNLTFSTTYSGAVYVKTNNYHLAISDTKFIDCRGGRGGAIYVDTNNNNIEILNSEFTRSFSYTGGAISLFGNNQYVSISNCLFTNSSGYYGGSIYAALENFAIVLTACTFVNSLGLVSGGAINMDANNDRFEIHDSVFMNSGAVYNGGAIFIGSESSRSVISNCTFDTTGSQKLGGGIYIGSEISDLIITNCRFINLHSEYGGAIYMYFDNNNAAISHNYFSNTSAFYSGGAIYVYASGDVMNIQECQFDKCTAGDEGGALFLNFDNYGTQIVMSQFTSCVAANGGALYIGSENNDLKISNVSFVDNSAGYEGGAVLMRDSNMQTSFENVTFTANYAGSFGGALVATSENMHMIFERCSFVDNLASLGGGAIYSILANSGFQILASMFQGNFGSYGGSLYFGTQHVGIMLVNCVVNRGSGDYGGGIFIDQYCSDVSLTTTTVSANTATRQGGGLCSHADDLTIFSCVIHHNKAEAGAGVYAPTMYTVNVSRSLFNENTATGGNYGALYVTSSSAIEITSNNFWGNQAASGGAVGVSDSVATILIQNNTFANNTALLSGGGLLVDGGSQMVVDNCKFSANYAEFGSGSAIWITANSYVAIQTSQFVANCAPEGGGAVYWLVSSGMKAPTGLDMNTQESIPAALKLELEGAEFESFNLFENNTALYGNNVATDAHALTMDVTNVYTVTSYSTSISPVVVYVVDYYNQIVKSESSGVTVTSVLSSAKCYQSSGYVTGGFIEAFQNGVSNFTTLLAYCDPGFAMSVNVTSPSLDVLSTYFTLNFRSCERGEYYQDRICIACEKGTYSLTDPSVTDLSDMSHSDVCKSCPPGADSCYGDQIEVKEGFWRISDTATTLLGCPYGENACQGGIESGDMLCHNGYEGPVCAVCKNGYAYRSATRQCEECSASSALDALTILIILAILLLALVMGVMYLRKIKGLSQIYLMVFTKLGFITDKTKNPERKAQFIARRFISLLKIYVTLWQIVSIMPFALDLQFPDVYSAILSALRAFNIDVSRSVLVTCSSGTSFDAIDGLVLDTVYPVVMVALLWLFYWIHICRLRSPTQLEKEQLRANYHKAFLIFTYLVLPSTSATIFQVFSCKDVDPDDVSAGEDKYMASDYSVSCSSSKYQFGLIWAVVSTLVYPVGIPAYYFYVLYDARWDIQQRSDDYSVSSKEKDNDEILLNPKLEAIRLLFEAYERKFWYWEVIETAKRLLLTGVLVLIAQGSAIQIIVGMSFSLFFLKLYHTFKPYVDLIVHRVESTSQWQVLLVFVLALLIKADFGSIDIVALDVCLILAVFYNFVVVLVKVTIWRYRVIVNHEVQNIMDATEQQSPMAKEVASVGALDSVDHVKDVQHLERGCGEVSDEDDDMLTTSVDKESGGSGEVLMRTISSAGPMRGG